jgi:hypothetical protein
MPNILTHIVVATLLLWVVRVLLPRQPRLRREGHRLVLRPPLGPLLWTTGGLAVKLLVVLYFLAIMVSAGVAWGVALGLLGLGWLLLLLWRNWRRAGLVFDREADSIRQGPTVLGRTSQAVGLEVTGEEHAALLLTLRDASGGTLVLAIPGIGNAQAPEFGHTIADYLGRPLVSRLPEPPSFEGVIG